MKQDDALNILRQIEQVDVTVRIQKFSLSTMWGDTTVHRDGTVKGIPFTEHIGDRGVNTWRARIGRSSTWHYGETMIDAIGRALSGLTGAST